MVDQDSRKLPVWCSLEKVCEMYLLPTTSQTNMLKNTNISRKMLEKFQLAYLHLTVPLSHRKHHKIDLHRSSDPYSRPFYPKALTDEEYKSSSF